MNTSSFSDTVYTYGTNNNFSLEREDLHARVGRVGHVLGILNEALRVNAEQAAKNAELVRVSGELKNLSGTVKPAVVGDKAKTAFGLLDELARSQEAYLDARKQLFEAAKAYYADLAAKKEVAAPEELNTLAAVVTAGLKKTVDLAGEFQKAIQEFDATLAAK